MMKNDGDSACDWATNEALGSRVGRDLRLGHPGREIRRRKDIDLCWADLVDVRLLAVQRDADAIQLRRQLVVHEIRCLPDARIAGGSEVDPRQKQNRNVAFFNARALPSRSRDLPPSRQNVCFPKTLRLRVVTWERLFGTVAPSILAGLIRMRHLLRWVFYAAKGFPSGRKIGL
jgi:hypothetical protein